MSRRRRRRRRPWGRYRSLPIATDRGDVHCADREDVHCADREDVHCADSHTPIHAPPPHRGAGAEGALSPVWIPSWMGVWLSAQRASSLSAQCTSPLSAPVSYTHLTLPTNREV